MSFRSMLGMVRVVARPIAVARPFQPFPFAALRVPARFASGLSEEGQTILDLLLKNESEAEGFYKEMAAKAKNDGFRNIFNMLAQEEAKHTEWIKNLAQDGELGSTVKLNKSLLVRLLLGVVSSEDTL